MTAYDVANMALDRLGSAPITSFTDTTNPHSARIGRLLPFYRDEVLALHYWPSAMKQKEIKELADIVWAPSTAYVADDFCENGDRLYQCFTGGTSAAAGGPLTEADDITDNGVHWRFIEAIGENQTAYAYRYPVPADCIRIKTLGNDGDQYDKIGGLIYTDALAISTTADGPVLRYVYRCTNYNLWDNLMIDALTLRLAGVLSPIIKGKPGTDFMSEFASIAQIAMTKQASEAKQKPKSSGLWTDQV